MIRSNITSKSGWMRVGGWVLIVGWLRAAVRILLMPLIGMASLLV